MKKNVLKKFTIERETISNLSKDVQGVIIGGYGNDSGVICVWSVDNWTRCPNAPGDCSGTCDLIDCDSHTYDWMPCP